VSLQLVVRRFFVNSGEIFDLFRSFTFPCLWNANLLITADGRSICCNDQAARQPQGDLGRHSIADLMAIKEAMLPQPICATCNQSPTAMSGSPALFLFRLAARARLALARRRR